MSDAYARPPRTTAAGSRYAQGSYKPIDIVAGDRLDAEARRESEAQHVAAVKRALGSGFPVLRTGGR